MRVLLADIQETRKKVLEQVRSELREAKTPPEELDSLITRAEAIVHHLDLGLVVPQETDPKAALLIALQAQAETLLMISAVGMELANRLIDGDDDEHGVAIAQYAMPLGVAGRIVQLMHEAIAGGEVSFDEATAGDEGVEA